MEAIGLPDSTIEQSAQPVKLALALPASLACTHKEMGKTFNHAYAFNFLVKDDDDVSGEEITTDELFAGAMAAVKQVDESQAWDRNLDTPFNSYEEA